LAKFPHCVPDDIFVGSYHSPCLSSVLKFPKFYRRFFL
jgi:hypothetical protein